MRTKIAIAGLALTVGGLSGTAFTSASAATVPAATVPAATVPAATVPAAASTVTHVGADSAPRAAKRNFILYFGLAAILVFPAMATPGTPSRSSWSRR
jgi:hypothetical protein